ncbi:TraR/DksA family transcriptional regulator [Janibacter limosus]|uniref:TraR/DksA family transcriptional regulator n=1 Tax=Janibacter limosus TaxID=53458 RepID=UPI00083785F3|nr:TraR/DksA C4-type zinc finger protein [Janibacter limosus]
MAANKTAKAGVKPAKGAVRATAKKVTDAPAKKAAAKRAPADTKAPAEKKAPAKKTPAKKAPAKTSSTTRLVVREDESPWTAKELKEVRAELESEIERLTTEITTAETDLSEFLKEPIDGAGDDQADAGAKSFEREHELNLVAGARTGLEQNQHALDRLEDGTYGICESCGNPIGKLRLQAYPRATLCMTCKSRQERR